jgi:hypothetical protein
VLEAGDEPGRALYVTLERGRQLFAGQTGLQGLRVEVGCDHVEVK